MKLTKEQAAIRQVEAAISALHQGDYDIAVTLAGAAEGMFERDGPHMFSYVRDHPRVADLPRKEWIAALNGERDWLKHSSDQSDMQIHRSAAAFMIARAASKIVNWTPTIEEYRGWLTANLDSLESDSDS